MARSQSAVKVLLGAGADINQKANQYHSSLGLKTPLAFAIDSGSAEIVAYLIEHGASLE